MPSITKTKLQSIIKEELKAALSEHVDHAQIREVVNVASKLLSAVEEFKESAGPAAVNAMTPGLDEVARTLEDMVSNPSSYVMKPKKEPKTVSLKAIKGK